MSTDSTITHVAAALAMVIAASSALGAAARKLGQPAVIGQLFAGIALGPSLLGLVPGRVYETLFPDQIQPILTSLAQVALVLFLFAVGYELDLGLLRNQRAVTAVSLGGFVIPMLMGAGIVLLFPGGFASANDGRPIDATFVLYVAIALSITAVPVLASIIRDQGLAGSRSGVVAMAAAGVIDALSWPVLAVVLLGGAHGSARAWTIRIALLVLFVLVTVFALRPLLVWWMRRPGSVMANQVPVAVTFALGSAWVTNALGLRVIFGALLAGIVMPRQPDGHPDSQLLRPLQETGGLLLPVFFTISGIAVKLGGLRASDLLLLAVICAAAAVSKVAAGALSARGTRMAWRDSLLIGVLLNTRGLTELIVLNVGLQAGVIGPRLYSLLVVMALLTTAASGPLIRLLRPPAAPPPPGPAEARTGAENAPGAWSLRDPGQAPNAGTDAEPAPHP
ncbi:cation:proton antiporter [Streptomyces sp. TS71-3]|uniref:cation:proton antiporter n=1 Tax=Streptomyces sp. TS71-3 TaxID=2733862 RepID=UPI001B09D0F7|nr:cation:proton antiporter [Streptomyces sp. TS71-3]GHJ37778.1 integral membrane ion exchanger [Streptomyces sp. TS71-3]